MVSAISEQRNQAAYNWALRRVIRLESRLDPDGREATDADWWALLRACWKAKLGLNPKRACAINGQWVDV